MPVTMTSASAASLTFGALIAIGLVILVLGIVLLIRTNTTGATGQRNKVTVAGVSINATPAGMIAVLGFGCLVVGAWFLPGTLNRQPDAPPVAVTTPPVTAPTASPPPSAAVTHPATGTSVGQKAGFTMGGTAGPLRGYSIWILDHPGHHSYYVDVRATVTSGTWKAVDRPLGSASDPLPYSLDVVAVTADPQCTATLAQLASDGSHTTAMPAGCHQFGQVTVNVDRR